MAEPIISFITENDELFLKAINEAGKKISDFRIPFGLIANDFYKSNRIIFTLKGPGLYKDLEPNYKIRKQKLVGFQYPILKRSGRLAKSLLSKNDANTEFFVGKQTLIMGTNVSYGKFHQSDKPRNKIPQRKFIFIDGGEKEVSRSARITGRSQRWGNIIADYVNQVLEGEA